MEIVAELTPILDREKLLARLDALTRYVEKVDIPEAPGGKPSAHSIAVGALAKQLGIEPIVHIRLLDINMTAYKSLLGGAYLLDIKYVVVLQGDPPAEGRPVGEISTEEAVAVAKKMGFKAGALLSLRRDYKQRLKIGADFYLALHLREAEQLADLPPVIYPYILVKTEKNFDLFERLGQTAVSPREALELVRKLEGLAPGVVLSVPRDFQTLLGLLQEVKIRP
ncbi:methylenetetrahydrofolate reductase [Pyrobaculum aerophilum]|uniref:5,10-methylenetetrahydrofolate reductase n=1 Tax=Pyrobaculum aerophilum TaxID=13773 RepID=A0A371R352_9CREN|nr:MULTISPECIES: methylenetetrahydrofolate reductase [Pyrobaculum]RFA95112.1 5,10-methylenetetrahydrofolate reductase [Pyrobaculum aerophilum]RFA98225.1 5,10-methylenetetrahydrofolate reductase [Pyrobaculum aerophilum]